MILRGLFFFVLLVVAYSILSHFFQVPFGTIDFFERRGVFFLIFITLFPRLTLLFSSVVSGGFIWWLGWFFFPRVLVAVLATFAYFQTNPILVTISWLVAISGESFEKKRVHVFRPGSLKRPRPQTPPPKDVIDVEFERKE